MTDTSFQVGERAHCSVTLRGKVMVELEIMVLDDRGGCYVKVVIVNSSGPWSGDYPQGSSRDIPRHELSR